MHFVGVIYHTRRRLSCYFVNWRLYKL